MKMEQIECSETSAYINQTPGNHPKENKQHSEHGESLKSRVKKKFDPRSSLVRVRRKVAASCHRIHI